VGNKVFRNAVTAALEVYTQADTRFEKSIVVGRIIEGVRAKGGRFLKQNQRSRTWEELTEQQMKEKVGHAVRDAVNTQDSRKTKKDIEGSIQVHAQDRRMGETKESSAADDEEQRELLLSHVGTYISLQGSASIPGQSPYLTSEQLPRQRAPLPQSAYAHLGPRPRSIPSHSVRATAEGDASLDVVMTDLVESHEHAIPLDLIQERLYSSQREMQSEPLHLSQHTWSSSSQIRAFSAPPHTTSLGMPPILDATEHRRLESFFESPGSSRWMSDTHQPRPYRPIAGASMFTTSISGSFAIPPAPQNLTSFFPHIDSHSTVSQPPLSMLPFSAVMVPTAMANQTAETGTAMIRQHPGYPGLATSTSNQQHNDQFLEKIDDVLGPLPPDAHDPMEALLLHLQSIHNNPHQTSPDSSQFPNSEEEPDTDSNLF
jgi:hypothetical protein